MFMEDVGIGNSVKRKSRNNNKNIFSGVKTYCGFSNAVEKVIKCETDER